MILIYTLIARPYRYKQFLYCNSISYSLFIISIISLLIVAKHDKDKCYSCSAKEGYLTWLIMIPLFLMILVRSIVLIYMTISMKITPNKFW